MLRNIHLLPVDKAKQLVSFHPQPLRHCSRGKFVPEIIPSRTPQDTPLKSHSQKILHFANTSREIYKNESGKNMKGRQTQFNSQATKQGHNSPARHCTGAQATWHVPTVLLLTQADPQDPRPKQNGKSKGPRRWGVVGCLFWFLC